MRSTSTLMSCLLTCLWVGACGADETPNTGSDAGAQGDAGGDAGEVASLEPMLPWKEGNTWTYRVVQDGVYTTKVQTVGPEERVGVGPNADKLAFKVVTKKGEADETISWQALVGDAVVRYREQAFSASTGELELEEYWDPPKLRVDGAAARRQAGASWLEVYQETKVLPGGAPETSERRERWLVDAVDEEVTVPAGTFRAIVLVKAGSGKEKRYWFVPGIGKVKETGGQTEELESFRVAP